MARDTSGLKRFAKARDLVLKNHGFNNFAAFTDATRAEYARGGFAGFDGWRKARDVALKKAGIANYRALLAKAKTVY
jgi:hypothetical protein